MLAWSLHLSSVFKSIHGGRARVHQPEPLLEAISISSRAYTRTHTTRLVLTVHGVDPKCTLLINLRLLEAKHRRRARICPFMWEWVHDPKARRRFATRTKKGGSSSREVALFFDHHRNVVVALDAEELEGRGVDPLGENWWWVLANSLLGKCHGWRLYRDREDKKSPWAMLVGVLVLLHGWAYGKVLARIWRVLMSTCIYFCEEL